MQPVLEIAGLPERQMWTVVEQIRNQDGCHLFTACRPDRPIQTYRTRFFDPRALDYGVGWRLHSGLDGDFALRPSGSMALDADQRAPAERIDGFSTIRQIAGRPESEPAALELFEELWRMDFVLVAIPPLHS